MTKPSCFPRENHCPKMILFRSNRLSVLCFEYLHVCMYVYVCLINTHISVCIYVFMCIYICLCVYIYSKYILLMSVFNFFLERGAVCSTL